MNISVFGVGYVGIVAAACLADGGNRVICLDKDTDKIKRLNNGILPIYEPGLAEIVKENEKQGRLIFTTDTAKAVNESKILILAVGTPSAADGSADISAILEAAGQIAELMKEYKIIITKSTVPVGTYKKVSELIAAKTKIPFDYVSNPEFLKEGAAVEDFMKPDRVIIGTDSQQVRDLMTQLYSPYMRKSSRIIFMSAVSAEMTKYAANTMLATRISFMNELSELCEKVGADINMVRVGIGSDSRIGSAFLFPGIGYGGSCFPKDVRALIHTGNEHGCKMTIAHAVQQVNKKQQQRFADTVISYFGKTSAKATIAAWGLAFKARTDDIRESPAIFCIEQFLKAGMKVRAFDPEAIPPSRKYFGNKIDFADSRDDCLAGCDGLVIFTDWQQFRSPDFVLIAKQLKKPVIFDGRNLYEPQFVRGFGIEYHSIGRI